MDSPAPQLAFEQNRAQVYAWAYRLLQNHHDALDVTQDVFIKWWRARGSGSVPENPLGWLRRITVNLAIDAIRSASRRASHRLAKVPGVAEAPDPTKRETARQIAAALETLTEHQRAVVVAKVYDGCTFAQIAEQMGFSVPTAKTHYLRGLQALRRRLPDADTAGGAGPTQSGDGHGP
jgi:RNA polymerase sigma-70 factor (ECF subfamily)